jgi:hypothetical protein
MATVSGPLPPDPGPDRRAWLLSHEWNIGPSDYTPEELADLEAQADQLFASKTHVWSASADGPRPS